MKEKGTWVRLGCHRLKQIAEQELPEMFHQNSIIKQLTMKKNSIISFQT